MSLALRFSLGDVDRLAARVNLLAGLDTRGLLDALGAEAESQTRRRIESEKRDPSGRPWASWTPAYAETRHGGHSLLMAEGHLHDSIQYVVGLAGDFVEVGSNLVYAAIHQFGGAEAGKPGIPARPYLGLSAEHLSDLGTVLDDWADAQLEAL